MSVKILYLATIDETTGEIITLNITGSATPITEGLIDNLEPPQRIKHLKSDDPEGWVTFSQLDILEQFWWDGENWKFRGAKTTPYSYWNVISKEWAFDTTKFLSALREERTVRLASCDWTQASDCQLSGNVQAQWRAYRQALRDIPDTYGDAKSLHQIGWPTPPDGSDISILSGP